MPASIIFNQTGSPAGVAGKARDDFAIGTAVVCTNATVETSYQWTLVDVPIRSALIRGSTSVASSFSFTPDVKGTYLIKLVVNGSSMPTDTAQSFCAIIETGTGKMGWRYKAAGESEEDNLTMTGLGFPGNVNTRGWATSEDLIYEDVESAVYDVDNAVVTSPGPGTDPLVRLNSGTGLLDPSVIPSVAGTSLDFVLDSGATPTGKVYNTLSALYSATYTLDGVKSIYIRDASTSVTAGTFDFRLYTAHGAATGSDPLATLTFGGTSIITGFFRELENTKIVNDRAGGPSLCTPAADFSVTLNNSTLDNGTAAVTMFNLTEATVASRTAKITLNNSTLKTDVIKFTAATGDWALTVHANNSLIESDAIADGVVAADSVSIILSGSSKLLGQTGITADFVVTNTGTTYASSTVVTGPATISAAAGTYYEVNCSAGAVTFNLPNAAEYGDLGSNSSAIKIRVTDISGNSGTNNITVTTLDSTTINGAASYVLNQNYESVTFQLVNNTAYKWVVVEDAGISELPATIGQQYAVLMEDPAGTPVFARLTEEMILPAFAIASFAKTAPNSSTILYRRGDTLTGVTASATYTSGPPTSASIANTYGGSTDGGDVDPGAWTINSPFATGSLAGSILRNGSDLGADPTWTFTLTATKTTVKTSAVTVTWGSDAYYGVGAAGLNTEAAIEALATSVLSTTRVRTITVSPSNQKVYYAYPKAWGTATFTLNGFPAAFNSPLELSITNVNGVTRTYYVYESTNLLTGSNLSFVVT